MAESETVVARRARRTRPRRRVSIVGILGEVLITVGAVVLLYVAWQLWIGDVIYAAEKNRAGVELSEQWQQEVGPAVPTEDPAPEESVTPADPAAIEPVILPQPGDAEIFGVMHIPRFGADYAMPIAGGVSRPRTLDPIGIGHYPDTAMPGEVGNFALAAHRTTFGKPFNRIADLRLGDAIVVETKEGWYTYRFRTLEYVTPDAVDVLLDVPQQPEVPAGERYITLTSCSPMNSMAERIVGYGLFESFMPRSGDAVPPALTEALS
ncbi:class E sortase [Microbacterium lushaniae]|uniref:Class E sortase n=1 Tax=Microbacterium lushaniae TaxID=2614639 RepID=A0A5J6KZP6_9MICO|nr:class E sortase [Microbacterium lushaniae]QEW01656.1 class E sortase [Microbacterium lushaniae]